MCPGRTDGGRGGPARSPQSSMAALMNGPSPLLVAAAFIVIADRWYIRFEEAAMRRKFGDAYAVYTERTRRWF